jgi:cytidylate kinase
MQQRFARRPPGAVLDGRDIGTVVCPEANVKLFVTATAEERARRRAKELRAAGISVDEGAILDDIRRRDLRDTTRPVAPLRPAEDAILLDTTNLDIDAAFRAAIDLIGRARSDKGVRRGP